ncbi:heavy metal translocating P-type ATPase [Cohnella abietis]|nr:cation-translocating P-type ATPase [Cohnella abietis]
MRVYITGMTCAACSSRIEKGLQRLEGVEQVSVNLATAQSVIQYDPTKLTPATVFKRIDQLGYGVEEGLTNPKKANEAEIRSYRNRFLLALLLSIPLLWAMLAHLPGFSFVWVPALLQSFYLQWGLASVLLFYVGYPFYYGAFQALKQRTANMDVLVVLSTTVAYFYSHYLMFRSDSSNQHIHLYFDTIAMIITVILLGKLLESIAKGKALKDLSELHDHRIRLIRVMHRKAEEWIPADKLRVGDIVVIQAGEWISADGIIESGCAEVDESLLTGEGLPILKSTNEYAYSGTRCLNGILHIKATCETHESRLSRMIAMVEEAQTNKPAIARKVDRVAAMFVPFMIACALITYAAWYFSSADDSSELAIRYALTVMLIACPCALGLATPVSILVATALSAKKGILFKHGNSLETLHRVNRILFDKTGTLTEGKPRLKTIQSPRHPSSYLLRMAAAVEKYSSHPLAHAITEAAQQQRLLIPEASGLLEIPGGGMKGIVEGKLVHVGHSAWIQSEGILLKGSLPINTAVENTGNVLYLSLERQAAGGFIFSDQLRDDASATVRQLREYAKVWMVTGDQLEPARVVAEQVGIEVVHSQCSPENKALMVSELRQEGHIVAFVGDGINDAAALAAADVGIAMGGGANIAMQTGDIVLSRSQITGVLDAIELSKRTMRNIKQNLTFALVYNSVAVPFAAMGYLDPRIACLGMAASSVIVVTNALRLQRNPIRSGS